MKRWEVEYDSGGGTRTYEFEQDATPTLEEGARELLRYLRDSDAEIPPLDQPPGIGEHAIQTLSDAGISVLEPRPIHDPD